jgi:hypothetical protein
MAEALAQRLEDGILQIVAFLPHLAAALGILLAGYAVAKMVERGTDVLLHRVGFDRWMREGGVTEALSRAGTTLEPSSVLAKLVFWTVMLLVILLASDALGLAVVSGLFAELLAYIPSVIAAVIVLVLGLLLGEFVRELVLASAGGVPGVPALARGAKAAIIVLAIFMALGELRIAEDIVLVGFIAVVGSAALAAGIAFGLGGREVAAELWRAWYDRLRRDIERDRAWREAEREQIALELERARRPRRQGVTPPPTAEPPTVPPPEEPAGGEGGPGGR